MTYSVWRRSLVEGVGTFWLVFGGCGSAVIAAGFPNLGIGFAGVALAFGLTLLTMVYTIGPISGCHINPAVSIGLWAARRFPARDLGPYIAAQIIGAIVAAGVLYLIASGKPGFIAGQFASNGFDALSPGSYGLGAVMLAEAVLTGFFVLVILGATDTRAPLGFAGLAIGFALTLVHLIGIPIDNTSVNPARSTGPALFAGTAELSQLWVFWVMPIIGAIVAGLFYRTAFGDAAITVPVIGERDNEAAI